MQSSSKSLSEALALGISAPFNGIKSLGSWLGQTIQPTTGSFWQEWLGAGNWSGQTVTTQTALQISAAWACVRLIAETLSTLPMGLYRSNSDGSKTLATGHQLYTLLRIQPNADMSASCFWQAYVASLLLWGNAYAEKRISSTGTITSIDFLLPDRISRRVLPSGAIEWRYADPVTGTSRIIPEAAMWHTPAFTLDGKVGISPIRMGANVLGGAIAADRASAHTFTGGMKSSGLVTTGATVLKPAQREDIRQHVKTVSDAGGVMVLEMGMGFQQLNMNPQDAELLATRIDILRLALLQAELAEYPSTGIVLHPSDWAAIELLKDSNGAYIFANPQSLAQPGLWGRPVVTTSAMTQDEFLVGAFQMGAQIFDREDANVSIATQHDQDFTNGLVTIRAEERLAMALYRPEAFVKGDLTPTP